MSFEDRAGDAGRSDSFGGGESGGRGPRSRGGFEQRGPRRGRPSGGRMMRARNRCRFCKDKVKLIDFKDVQTLQRLCTMQGKIHSRKRSGSCAKHQRRVKTALKRARFMALLPYLG